MKYRKTSVVNYFFLSYYKSHGHIWPLVILKEHYGTRSTNGLEKKMFVHMYCVKVCIRFGCIRQLNLPGVHINKLFTCSSLNPVLAQDFQVKDSS